MAIPMEIIVAIASNLGGDDLRSFRLVCKQYARAGLDVLARNGFTILNTSSCLRDFEKDILECNTVVNRIRELTFLHGHWPVCSRREWEQHPLLLGGKAFLALELRADTTFRTPNRRKLDNAFATYQKFIAGEQKRRPLDDIDAVRHMLRSLPKLEAVKISTVYDLIWHPARNFKFYKLQKSIWLFPYVLRQVEYPTQIFLSALGDRCSSIERLAIKGRLDLGRLSIEKSIRFTSIRRLDIRRLVTGEDRDAVNNFFLRFPNLVYLSIQFQGPRIPGMENQYWNQLKTLYLADFWASEQEFFALYQNHKSTLKSFCLNNPTLIQGSWKSLFTRIRRLNTTATITAEGELYGRRKRDSITMSPVAVKSLEDFIKNSQLPWPFPNSE
jgi:hypothetical protein